RKPSVHLDENLSVAPGHAEHSLQNFQAAMIFLARKLQVAISKGIELQPAIAAGQNLLRGAGERFRRAIHRVPAVGISWNILSHFSTEQLIDGQLGLFANA